MLNIKPIHYQYTNAIIAFEQENKAFFDQYVPPRSEQYFNKNYLKNYIKELMLEAEIGKNYMHLVFFHDQLIGRMNLTHIKQHEGKLQAEIGYRFTPNVSGKGYGKQALFMMIGLAKTKYKIAKLVARADPNNIASTKLLLSNQFHCTNVMDTVKLNQRSINLMHYEKIL